MSPKESDPAEEKKKEEEADLFSNGMGFQSFFYSIGVVMKWQIKNIK